MAIVGPNGIGKSTLLKSVLGQIPFVKGSSEFGTNVKVGYYDQEQHNLHDKKTVLNELWDDHPTTPEKDIRSILGSFLLSVMMFPKLFTTCRAAKRHVCF